MQDLRHCGGGLLAQTRSQPEGGDLPGIARQDDLSPGPFLGKRPCPAPSRDGPTGPRRRWSPWSPAPARPSPRLGSVARAGNASRRGRSARWAEASAKAPTRSLQPFRAEGSAQSSSRRRGMARVRVPVLSKTTVSIWAIHSKASTPFSRMRRRPPAGARSPAPRGPRDPRRRGRPPGARPRSSARPRAHAHSTRRPATTAKTPSTMICSIRSDSFWSDPLAADDTMAGSVPCACRVRSIRSRPPARRPGLTPPPRPRPLSPGPSGTGSSSPVNHEAFMEPVPERTNPSPEKTSPAAKSTQTAAALPRPRRRVRAPGTRRPSGRAPRPGA